MQIDNILTPERVVCNVQVNSKKRALEVISELLTKTQPELNQQEIFESLLNRERLGSTSLGHGVALPHGRVKSSDHTLGVFIQLKDGIDFDAIDNQPVDLLFGLLVPEESTQEHLQILSMLAKLFSDEKFREKLRTLKDSNKIYDLITHWNAHQPAKPDK
jgi:PTS system nitrogen regulatory IIA component